MNQTNQLADEQFIECAKKDGFWLALRKFGIHDKSEWLRLQKLMEDGDKWPKGFVSTE